MTGNPWQAHAAALIERWRAEADSLAERCTSADDIAHIIGRAQAHQLRQDAEQLANLGTTTGDMRAERQEGREQRRPAGRHSTRRPPDTYENFAAWHVAHPDATTGDAMRRFSGTPVARLLEWWQQDRRAAGRLAEGPCPRCGQHAFYPEPEPEPVAEAAREVIRAWLPVTVDNPGLASALGRLAMALPGWPGRELDVARHQHTYGSQTLRHAHPGGGTPHGYFGHPEDPPVIPDQADDWELL